MSRDYAASLVQVEASRTDNTNTTFQGWSSSGIGVSDFGRATPCRALAPFGCWQRGVSSSQGTSQQLGSSNDYCRGGGGVPR